MRKDGGSGELGASLRGKLDALHLGNRLARRKSVLRHHHRRNRTVYISDICNIGRVIYVDRAIDIGVVDLGHVGVVDIGDIHAVTVGRAGVVPGLINLAWSEREPGGNGADRNGKTATSPADKRDQGGRVDGADFAPEG